MIKIITIITALKTSLKSAELMLLKHFRADALFERSLMETQFIFSNSPRRIWAL